MNLKIRKEFCLIAIFILVNFVGLMAVAKKVMPKGPVIMNDIKFIWQDGRDIANGINPYAKIHGSDMLNNKKYSTYLPGFFTLVAVTYKMGIDTLQEFLKYWRPATVLIHLGLGTFIFALFLFRGMPIGGLAAGGFYLYNRFSLSVMGSGQIDILALWCLVISLALATENKDSRWSPIWFGISLAIKQIGILFLPAYLLLLSGPGRITAQIKKMIQIGLRVAIVPFIVSLPFLISDAVAFFQSILFSATRKPIGHIRLKSYDVLLGMIGIEAKIPMLILMAFVFWMAWKRMIGFYGAALMVFAIFMAFNSVILWQYFIWMLPFVPLVLLESPLYKKNTVA